MPIFPSIDDLELYVKVCPLIEEGNSFTEIALHIKRRKATISETITKLEEHFGECLVARTERKAGSTLTEAGRNILQRAEQVLSAHQQFKERHVTSLSICTAHPLLPLIIPELLSQFLKKWKGQLHLHLSERSHSDMINALNRSEIDIGIGPAIQSPTATHLSFTPMPASSSDTVVICQLNHDIARKKRKSVSLDSLKGETVFLLSNEDQSEINNTITKTVISSGGKLNHVHDFTSLTAFPRLESGIAIVMRNGLSGKRKFAVA